jgi:phage tail sheath protein FI
VYVMDHETTLANSGSAKKGQTFDNAQGDAFVVKTYSLASGTDDFVATNSEIATAYEKFNDTENVDISLLLCGPSQTGGDATGDTKATAVMDIANDRKDCVAFISPARADVVDVANAVTQTQNVVSFADGLPSTSYAVIDSGYKQMYDKYNDVYRFVPLNGDIAGLCARTDNIADPFFSPAGYNRGQIRGAVKLAFNPNQAQRDELYKARVNPVVTFPGQGTVLFGDKTAQAKPSAFDRINVRRLFIVLEKAISTAAKFQLFEFNDEFTRAQFRNLVEPFLRDIQGRRGITEFSVICDDSNNTADVIDRSEFRSDIFIKPARSINFIQLNFVATRTGVAFSEVVGA